MAISASAWCCGAAHAAKCASEHAADTRTPPPPLSLTQAADGTQFVDILKAQGIVPGIKVDTGLQARARARVRVCACACVCSETRTCV